MLEIAWAAVLSLAIWLPVLGRGWILRVDMVFVPQPALSGHGLGLDGSVPRAVPGDWLIALVGQVVPTSVLQQGILLLSTFFGAWGAARIVPSSLPGRLAAAAFFSWNVYVYERLMLGHWALLAGVAALPWVLRSALALRRAPRTSWPRWGALAVPLGVAAAASPTSGVLAATLALVLAGPGQRAWLTLGTVVVLNAPWLVPGALAAGAVVDPATGVQAFAARADTPLGAVASVLSFGGAWSAQSVPPGRDSLVGLLGAVIVLVAAGYGVRPVLAAFGSPVVFRVGAWSAIALLVSVASALPGGVDLMAAVVAHIPGGGLLRDAQKWSAAYLLVVAVLFGSGIARLTQWAAERSRGASVVAATGGILLPLAVVPALGWAATGELSASRWPASFERTAQVVDALPGAGRILVLPWSQYRAWPWDPGRNVLDPWNRLLHRSVLGADELVVGNMTVPGESTGSAEISRVMASGGSLTVAARALGVRYVLVDTTTAGPPVDPAQLLPDAVLVQQDGGLHVYDLGGPVATDLEDSWSALIVAVDLTALAVFLAGAFGCVVPRLGHRRETASLLQS